VSGLNPSQRHVVQAAVSRLLQYPDAGLLAQLPALREAAESVPVESGDPLARFVEHLASTPLLQLQADYVATFDLRRKACLYLSYYLNGDTRRRGMALWRFLDAYRSVGYQPVGGELPDFLPTVLELAATGDEDVALALLHEHREGIEVLREALAAGGSPYAGVVRALEAALPAPSAAVRAAAARLAAEGPPTELVGLEPFVPVESVGVRP